jgi:hypothetical protein
MERHVHGAERHLFEVCDVWRDHRLQLMHLFVAKRHKGLWIIYKETDQAVYTPPDFVILPGRAPMHHLAFDLMRLERIDINRIAAFEWGVQQAQC